MKKLFLIPLLFIAAVAHATLDEFEIPVPKGMITNYESTNLKDDFCTYAENVRFDKDSGVIKRYGYDKDNLVTFGTASVRNLNQYITPTRTQYLLAITGSKIQYSLNNSSWIVITSTLAPTDEYEAVAAFGRITYTSQNYSFYWTGGAGGLINTSTGMPEGRYIEKFVNCLWVAGVNGSRSFLYKSGQLDPDSFAIPAVANPTEPAIFVIGANDGDVITGIYAFANGLVVFKNYSTWVVIGNDNRDFEIRNISNKIGCIQQRSIQEKQGKLIWLSKRGLESLAFNKLFAQSVREGDITPLSEPISDIMDKLVTGYDVESVNSVVDTSQSDFNMGRSTYVSTTQEIDSIIVSSPSVNYTTATPIAGDSQHKFYNSCFGGQSGMAVAFVPKMNCNFLGARIYTTLKTLGSGNRVTLTTYFKSGDTAPAGTARDVGTSPESDTFSNIGVHNPFSPLIVFTGTGSTGLVAGTTYWVEIEPVQAGGGSCPGIESFTQKSLDPTIERTFYSTTIVRADPTQWGTVFSSANMTAIYLSSSQFFSEIKDLGTSVSRFLNFNANYTLDGGSVQLFARSGTTRDATTAAVWTAQVNGSTFAAATNRFVQYRVDLGRTSVNQYPSLQSATLQYVDSTSKQSVVSWIEDDSYFLAHTTRTNSTSTNDAVLIYDSQNNFGGIDRNIYAASYATAFDRNYFGISYSSGFVYYFNFTYLDDGLPIRSVLELKDFSGKDYYRDKLYYSLFLKTVNPGSGAGSMSVSYQLDKDGVYFDMGSVSMTEQTGLITAKVPFPFSAGGMRAKSVRFRLVHSAAGQDFRFYGGKVYYDLLPVDY